MESSKKEINQRMFNALRESIGKEVTVTYWHYGRLHVEKSILSSVTDFERVELKGMSIPFIGYGVAIVSIIDSKGIMLYGHLIQPKYDVRDSLGIIEVKREFFGDEIADKELEEERKYEERRKEQERKDQERIIKFQTEEAAVLIEKTLPYIIESERENFKQMVANNNYNMYGILIVKMTSELLIAIGQGMEFEEAIKTIAEEKYGTSGFAMGVAANAISSCSPRGEEFRKYWNRLHGISDEEKGVVNPAILTIKSKK